MKRLLVHLVLPLATGLVLMSACTPTVPSKYLQPDEMEDLMYDYYVSQGLYDNQRGSTDYQHRYNLESVLRKYDLTYADFDSSLVYYYNNLELLNSILSNVQDRLSKEALELGASEGEVERYTTQSISGDTTDVWEGRRHLTLLPVPPYHVIQFAQKADTSFHQGDSFLMTFGTKFLTRNGSRNASACMAVTYENDSVVSLTQNLNISGGNTLRIASCSLRAKKIEGFVYMPRRGQSEYDSELCILFVDHIQLMRFHHHQNKQDTAPVVPDIKEKADSVDSLKPRARRLGERPLPQATKPANQTNAPVKPLRQLSAPAKPSEQKTSTTPLRRQNALQRTDKTIKPNIKRQ